MSKFSKQNYLISAIISVLIFSISYGQHCQLDNKTLEGLKPVGYWRVDEGQGDIIFDSSGNDNHGKVYQVPWEGGLLNFTSAFQWVEIPSHQKYQSRDFSIGGWVFIRSEVVGGGWKQRWGLTFFGNGYHSSGFDLDTLYDKPVVYGKSQWGVFGGSEAGVSLCIRGDEFVDIVSGGKPDVLGSRAGEVGVSIGKWHHILYTFQAGAEIEGGEKWKQLQDSDTYYNGGTGRLYIDAQLVKTQENIPFESRDRNFLIGSDAVWWLQADVSGSLDGSIGGMIMFDRTISAKQVQSVYQATMPNLNPKPFQEAKQSESNLDKAELSQLIEILEDDNLSQSQRAKAALSIAEMGMAANEAASNLRTVLNGILQAEGARLLRTEDLLRNAVIKALLDIDAKSEQSRRLLGLAYAKPFFDSIDISKPYLDKVKPLVVQGRFMDAMDIYRTLNLKENGDFFFSQGDVNRDRREWQPNTRAYTAMAEFNGFTYRCGEGEAWKGVEKVPFDQYKELVVEISGKYPEVLNWRSVSYEHLYRVPIIKTAPDGSEKSVYLGGEKFILDGNDAKLRGWSIAVDNDGYIHITGGMHNAPVEDNFIPGSWEQMGVSREYTDDNHPSLMYWVSSEPENIDSLEFMGQRANPRNVPVPFGMNYMNFIQDRSGELYLYGRIHVQGIQSFGLYKYDTGRRRWDAVGGYAPDVKEEYPHWADFYIRMAGDWLALPTIRWRHDIPCNKALVWARQPHFYNYMRGWGVRFDKENRMHVLMPVFGLNSDNMNVLTSVYAFSDDGGKSFRRFDGSEVKLPLTNNPSEDRNAEIESTFAKKWLKLYESLINHAGYKPMMRIDN
jgi:hypothetical protein